MKLFRTFIAIAAMLALPTMISAQNNTVSPYSRFGYGHLNDQTTSAQRAMGGVGYAMNNGRQINPMNPASYANIDTLTFLCDIGVDFKYVHSTEGDKKGHRTTAGLDYLTMQFPISNFMGASIGILPYSEVGYRFGEEVINGEASNQGSGSINEVYAGVSARPFKGFSVGANVSYLFGTLLNDTYMTTSNSSTTLFEQVLEVRDYNLRFGLQYSHNIGSKHRLTLGAVYSPAQDFRGRTYGVYYDISTDIKADTVGMMKLRHNFSRPATYGGGINYQWHNRLMAEADFTFQPWAKSKFAAIEGFETTRLTDRWKASLGIQYQPDPRGNYGKRIRYRVGAYIDRDYIMVGDNNVKDFGLTLGFGLPAPINRLTKTVVNIGFEWRHRTTSPMRLVTENHFQVTLGINFNELWFWQNKIQ